MQGEDGRPNKKLIRLIDLIKAPPHRLSQTNRPPGKLSRKIIQIFEIMYERSYISQIPFTTFGKTAVQPGENIEHSRTITYQWSFF